MVPLSSSTKTAEGLVSGEEAVYLVEARARGADSELNRLRFFWTHPPTLSSSPEVRRRNQGRASTDRDCSGSSNFGFGGGSVFLGVVAVGVAVWWWQRRRGRQ